MTRQKNNLFFKHTDPLQLILHWESNTAIYWSRNINIYFLVCVIQCHLSHGQAQKKTTFFLIEWTHTDRNILFTFEFAGQISIKMHDCPQQRHLIGSSKSLQYRKFWPRNNMVFLCVNKQNLLLNHDNQSRANISQFRTIHSIYAMIYKTQALSIVMVIFQNHSLYGDGIIE